MATIDIGKIKPVFKGTYNNSTAYVLDDIVYYNGSSYVAKTSTTGNLPTDTTKWNILASGSGGIWDSTLSLGSASQQLRVNSGGTALEFADIAGGAFGQMVMNTDTTTYSNSSTSSYVRATNSNVVITPSSASKSILVIFNVNCRTTYTDSSFQHKLIRIVGGTETVLRETSSVYSYEHYSGTSSTNRYWMDTQFFIDAPNTTSAVTYTYEFRNAHNANTIYINNNDQSQFLALEIN